MAVVTLSGASGALAGCLIGLATNIYAEKSMEPNVLLDPDKYPATLTQLDDKDGGGWLASYPDLPGCYGHGSTQAEALKDGTAAVLHWIKAHEERNLSVPRLGRMVRRVGTFAFAFLGCFNCTFTQLPSSPPLASTRWSSLSLGKSWG